MDAMTNYRFINISINAFIVLKNKRNTHVIFYVHILLTEKHFAHVLNIGQVCVLKISEQFFSSRVSQTGFEKQNGIKI